MTAQDLLEEMGQLSELAGENPFKTRAFKNASQVVAGRDDLLKFAKDSKLTSIQGIGKGISEILTEFLINGTTSERDRLLKSLPDGLLELSSLPGLGPKKARTLIEKLGVQSLRELEYAAKEGRVARIEGFGESSQIKILEAIRFKQLNSTKIRLSDAMEQSKKIIAALMAKKMRAEETGELRRKCEIVSGLDFLIEGDQAATKKAQGLADAILKEGGLQVPARFHAASNENWGFEWARTTASEAHWKAIGSPKKIESKTEDDFYKKLKLPFISPEMRETGDEVEVVKKDPDAFLPWDGIRGVFHNHTVRSDGQATLEQMVQAAQDLGYEYIGISEHSETSFYARGLKLADINAQEKEIQELQKKFKIRIFWGIESDILRDGALDYPESVLKRFDFVIGSIHQRFKLDKELMTERIVSAIRNPYMSIVGHLTGRLLLDRAPYEIDIERIIREASQHGVAIEINANPQRLDIDWRWGPQLRKHGTAIFVNPDAHTTEGLQDTSFGIAMARKALLPKKQIINSGSAADVEKWLKNRRKK